MYKEIHIKEAFKSELISSMTETELNQVLRVCIATIHMDLMRELPPKQDLEYTLQNIQKIIQTKYQHFHKNEILISWRNGISNKYGEWFGINVISLEKFLQAHNEERRRIPREPITEANRLLELTPTNDEDFEKFLIDNWKTKRIVLDLGNSYYRKLEKEGKIVLTNEQKWEYFNRAKEQLEKEYQRKPLDLYEMRDLQKSLEKLRNGSKDTLIKSRAMLLAVEDYFKKTIDDN